MMGWYYGGGWVGWLMMTLAMAAFWGVLIFAAVAIFRGTRQGDEGADRPSPRDPRSILDERFARGEIGADEYQARRDALRGAADAPEGAASLPAPQDGKDDGTTQKVERLAEEGVPAGHFALRRRGRSG